MRLVIVLLCCLSLVACATRTTIPIHDPADLRDAFEVGETVTLVTRSGRELRLAITERTATHVRGAQGGRHFSVPIADIVEVRRRDVEAGEITALAILGAAAAVGLVYLLVHAMADATEDCARGETCN